MATISPSCRSRPCRTMPALTGVDMPDLSQSGIERAVAEAVRDEPVSFDLRVR